MKPAVPNPRVLVVAIRGTSMKVNATGEEEVRKRPHGPTSHARGSSTSLDRKGGVHDRAPDAS
jgi:hypothetical protein